LLSRKRAWHDKTATIGPGSPGIGAPKGLNMPREAIALSIPDLSDFARRLGRDLEAADPRPGHLSLLNMIARAAGFRNYQHLRSGAARSLPTPPEPPVPSDPKKLAQASRLFDAGGRMIRWPKKTSIQALCVWALWARLPARQDMTEAEVNRAAEAFHLFGDRALLRRSLIDHGLAERARDGSTYRRIERQPPPEARDLIRALAERQ